VSEFDSTPESMPEGGAVPGSAAAPYVRSDRKALKRSRMIRLGVLALSLFTITAIGILHQKSDVVKTVGVDALCPFGGIETLWAFIAGGALLQRIALSSLVLLGIVVLTAFVFRRSFCGYICPLGALQEFVGKIGNVIWPKGRPKMPAALDRPARLLKYLVLVFFTVATWQAATLVIRPYDPWVAYMHLTSGELFTEFSIGLAVLAVSLVGSVVYDRFFCKYLCPMGAFLGILSPLSLFKVRRNADSCISCSACDKACPVNLTVSEAEVVTDPECINCNECVNVCPVANTLEVSTGVAKGSTAADPAVAPARTVLRPNQALFAVAGLIALFLGATTIAGAFEWTIPTLSQEVQSSGGALNPEDIKGRMSFAEISSATGIAPEVFESQYGVKPEEMTTPIKDLAPVYGFDVHTDVREFVAQAVASGLANDPGSTTSTSGDAAGGD